jgi:plastocyanin
MEVRMKHLLAVPLFALAALSPAQAAPPVVQVTMTNFSFAPSALQLQAGVPIVLRLRNDAGGGQNFAAPAFFRAARVEPASAGLIREGRVEVPAHSAVNIALVPAAGQYPVKCTHTLHSAFGMKGRITVR